MSESDERRPARKQRGNSALERHRWRLGQSGNPNGRPRGSRTLSAAYRDVLDAHPELLKSRETLPTIADEVARAMARRATRGGVAAAQELGDRSEGKSGVRGAASVTVTSMLLALPPLDGPPPEDLDAMFASTAASLLGLPEPEPLEAEGPGEEPEEGDEGAGEGPDGSSE